MILFAQNLAAKSSACVPGTQTAHVMIMNGRPETYRVHSVIKSFQWHMRFDEYSICPS